MKKLLIMVFLISALALAACTENQVGQAIAPASNCIDSDGNLGEERFFTAGTVTLNNREYDDYCSPEGIVVNEYYCKRSIVDPIDQREEIQVNARAIKEVRYTLGKETFPCEYGCSAGRCKYENEGDYFGCDDPALDTQGKTCVELSGCDVLNESNTYYLLMNNTYADGTCFEIGQGVSDLDFNLNTFEVTFGMNAPNVDNCGTYAGYKSGKICSYGISVLGGGQQNVHIHNGKITQAEDDTLSFSDAVYLRGTNVFVNDLDITVTADDSAAVVLRYANNVDVRNLNIDAPVENIENRHQLHGAIYLQGVSGTIQIDGNTIVDAPQVGISIVGVSQDTSGYVANNRMRLDSDVPNAYGIALMHADNLEVYENSIYATNGRGIYSTSDNVAIYDNTINVSQGGSLNGYGIRLYGAENNEVHDNVVTVIGHPNGGGAMPLSVVAFDNANHDIWNNEFIAISSSPSDNTKFGAGVQLWGNAADSGVQIHDNVFYSNSYILDTDGAMGDTVLKDNSFVSIGTPQGFAKSTYLSSGYGPATILPQFLDNNYGNFDTRVSSFYGPGSAGYDVAWTLTVNAIDLAGNPVGALAIVKNGLGEYVAGGFTDAQGRVSFDLNEFTYTYLGGTTNITEYNPYTLEVATSYDLQTRVVTLDQITQETFVFFDNTTQGCADGATQQCGISDVGRCAYGTQTCTAGVWGNCEGAINPIAEQCSNDVDDDCDGLTDTADGDCEMCTTRCILKDPFCEVYVDHLCTEDATDVCDDAVNTCEEAEPDDTCSVTCTYKDPFCQVQVAYDCSEDPVQICEETTCDTSP